MTYNYSKLRKMLVDKNMSWTEICKRTGISLNMLTKVYKDEPVSMEILTKICTVLNCKIDEIVDVFNEQAYMYSSEIKYGISNATVRNWEKLNTHSYGRLTTRANKRKSKRRIIPLEYFSNVNNISFVKNILSFVDENDLNIMSVIFSLGVNLLKCEGIYDKTHVRKVLSEYSDVNIINDIIMMNLPSDEFDLLGLIYQSYLQEGKRNIVGLYYTPQKIAHQMTKDFDFSDGKLFLDPCCGSGSFLLTVSTGNPYQIFGVDNDKVAVLISKINLLLKYSSLEFIPQVYCLDFLMDYSTIQQQFIFGKKFDYIATNPPWGAMDQIYDDVNTIASKETFSYFFLKAYDHLKKSGKIRFLFPESILNVKKHKDIRRFILNTAGLVCITPYDNMFSGVTTKYVDIECGNGANKEYFMLNKSGEKRIINLKTVYETENLVLNLLSDEDISIIKTVKNRGQYSLQNSVWAIGIVTGDNKSKLFSESHEGMEKIYTGKEIQPFTLQPARNYIVYDRNNLQQVAKDEIYRAPEKLVYKFISSKPVFAYDDSGSLFLNSANILIPTVPSMSIKSVMAFLNSMLFQFMYMKLFGEVKILKGNLMELQFPKLSKTENTKLTMMVDEILKGKIYMKSKIDEYIFALYGLTEEQITYIRRTVNGKIG